MPLLADPANLEACFRKQAAGMNRVPARPVRKYLLWGTDSGLQGWHLDELSCGS